jgi:hypothetical protein
MESMGLWCSFGDHFLQYNSSFQNSRILNVIRESIQLLGVTSNSSWPYMAQLLALDIKYEWVRIVLVKMGLCSKHQHYGSCKFSCIIYLINK